MCCAIDPYGIIHQIEIILYTKTRNDTNLQRRSCPPQHSTKWISFVQRVVPKSQQLPSRTKQICGCNSDVRKSLTIFGKRSSLDPTQFLMEGPSSGAGNKHRKGSSMRCCAEDISKYRGKQGTYSTTTPLVGNNLVFQNNDLF